MSEPVIKPQENETKENIAALAIFAVLMVIVGALLTNGYGFFSKPADTAQRVAVNIGNSPVKGNLSTADVVIVIYSDFECPFCKKGEESIALVEQKYAEKVALVFKQFPLKSIHPHALNASIASLCANEQGKFWEYHDYLFEHNTALGNDDLKAYARELGLNELQFNACFDSRNYEFIVDTDFLGGRSIGVSSTPTFFVNGIPMIGAQPAEEFYKVIDAELAK